MKTSFILLSLFLLSSISQARSFNFKRLAGQYTLIKAESDSNCTETLVLNPRDNYQTIIVFGAEVRKTITGCGRFRYRYIKKKKINTGAYENQYKHFSETKTMVEVKKIGNSIFYNESNSLGEYLNTKIELTKNNEVIKIENEEFTNEIVKPKEGDEYKLEKRCACTYKMENKAPRHRESRYPKDIAPIAFGSLSEQGRISTDNVGNGTSVDCLSRKSSHPVEALLEGTRFKEECNDDIYKGR